MFQRPSTSNGDLRRLIVNADDFGQSHGINDGILESHQRGIVTSASLMVRWPAAVEAAALARAYPQLSLGLHVDVGEWSCDRGQWKPLYQVVNEHDEGAVRAEVASQLERFQDLVGRAPTHIDSHQHRHRHEPLRSILIDTARELQVPLREHDPRVRYCGLFYGQMADGIELASQVSWSALIAILRDLPSGVTELCCHPARDVDFTSMYADARLDELRALTDPRVRESFATFGIELCAFKDLSLLVT
jgi:predicted glycoside hydrolase/deacetylase ChbG (UPF0249 family)